MPFAEDLTFDSPSLDRAFGVDSEPDAEEEELVLALRCLDPFLDDAEDGASLSRLVEDEDGVALEVPDKDDDEEAGDGKEEEDEDEDDEAPPLCLDLAVARRPTRRGQTERFISYFWKSKRFN